MKLVPRAAFGRHFWIAVALGCAAWPALAAGSRSTADTPREPGKVRFIDAPSSEKPAERKRRLKRECQGRPNAGMCLGHTR